MANQVKIDLSVQDTSGSIKKRTSEVQGLNKELTRSQQLATGTQTGSRAVRASYSAATAPESEGTEYGRARGSMGATGAGARDFANQAQGLGGLVRLYATYAANVFAVSAAFSALRESMNTDIMIRGLNQLGAASGVAMGGLAKQFADASDGAISLREAMEATAKATTSGLSSKQFMELGVVAKGASQALGVNMSDAVSRLTRGITKLEPELLDELGIFTKVGKATEDYARSVGKSVASLTDFERRQAFANAVLAEGRQKFGEIAGEANPYDKLLASLTNVAQQILSVVNSVVAPIAKILANNTELIGLAIAAAAVKITQQALPALSQWRRGLADAAQDAAKRAQEVNTSFGEAFVARAERKQRIPQLDAAIEQAQKEFNLAKKQFVELDNVYKKPNSTLKALQEDRLLTEKELSAVKSDITKKTNLGTEAELKHALSLTEVQLKQQKITDLVKERAKAYALVEEEASKSSRVLSGEWQREKIVASERAKAARLGMLSEVGSKVEEKGLFGGLGSFYSDVDSNKDLGKFDKLKTKAIGTFAGIGTAAGILGKSLAGAFVYLEIAIAAFGLLNMAFSTNGKEVDALKSGLDGLSEATKTATDVAKKYGNTLSTDSLNAIANSFVNLADGVEKTSQQLNAALKASSWFDSVVNMVKSLWGGDIQSKFADGLTDSIVGAIKVMPEGELKSSLEDRLKKVTGSVTLEQENLSKAFGNLGTKDLQKMGLQVTSILDSSRKALVTSQALTQDVKETGKAVSDSFTALSTSIKDNSPVNTFMTNSIKQALALQKALKDTYAAQVVLKDLAAGTIKPQFLTDAAAIQIMPLAQEASTLADQAKRFSDNLTTAKNRTAEINKEIQRGGNYTWYDAKLRAEREALKGIISDSESGLANINARVLEISKQAQRLIKDSIISQIDASINQTAIKISQLKTQDKLSAVSELPVKTAESIKYTADLQKQALEQEKLLYKSNESLVRSLDLLALQVQRDADLRELEKLRNEPSDQVSRSRQSMLTARVANTEAAMGAYTAQDVNTLKRLAYENPQLKGLIDSVQGSILANAGFSIKAQQINSAQTTALINLKYDDLLQESQNRIKQFNTSLEKVVGPTAEAETERIGIRDQIAAEQLRQTETLPAERKLALNQALSSRVGNASVIAAGAAKIQSQASTAVALGKEADATKNSNDELQNKLRLKREENDLTNTNYAISNLAIVAEEAANKASIAYRMEQLNLLNAQGAISADDYAAKQADLKLEEARIDRAQQLRQATEAKTAAEQAYQLALDAEGGKVNANLTAQKKLYEDTYSAAVKGANDTYDRTKALLELQNSQMDRQKAYTDLFKQAFKGMEDAIVEFTKTGKLNFTSMINSFLEDLLRYEIRQQQQAMFQGMGDAGGMAKWLMRAMGIGTPGVANPSGATGADMDLFYSAKGSAYDYGVQAFAKGGLFTNSIVDSPTLFKFAKGTGLMGEAGPEAIMPLTRDGNGNLGVRAQGGGSNVEVVVNNYSTAKAETRETTDSRGNRRIEVVVGDMVAQEVTRTGSAAQTAFSSTYGTRPALARR